MIRARVSIEGISWSPCVDSSDNIRRIGVSVILVVLLTVGVLPSQASAVSLTGSEAPYVKYTLDLSTNSLLDGNVLPAKSTAAPFDIAYDPSNGKLYVADYGSGVVDVIDGAANKVLSTIAVGGSPYAVSFDAVSDNLYVAVSSGNVAIIDGATNRVLGTVPITAVNGPSDIAFNPLNGDAYIPDSAKVSVASGATNRIVGAVEDFGKYGRAYALAFGPHNGFLYVAAYVPPVNTGHDYPYYDSNTLVVVNSTTNTIVATTTIGANGQPYGLAYDPSKGNLYMTNYENGDANGTVSVIDTATNNIVITLEVSGGAYDAALDSSNGYLYVSDASRNGTVSIISDTTNKVVGTLDVGNTPLGVAFDPMNGYLYVANEGSGTVSIVSSGTASAPLSTTTSQLLSSTTVPAIGAKATSTGPNQAATTMPATTNAAVPMSGNQIVTPESSSLEQLASAAALVLVSLCLAYMIRKRAASGKRRPV